MGVNSDIKAMHGTLEQFEDAIDKRINTDVMLRIENLEKDNQKALGDLQSQIGDSISQRMKPSEDKLREVDGEISGLHKTVAIFESRHVETTNSLKEVTVVTERIQTQVTDQGQKMVEQSTTDLMKINEKLAEIKSDSELQLKRIADLENIDQVHGSDIKTLFDTSSRYLQNIQELEILNDKVSNMDDYHTRSENKMKVELIETITKNSETLKSFCQTSIEKSEQNLSQNIVKLEEESRELSEKIVSLQNFAMVQEQKTSIMDTLSSRVNQIDEMRQQSESKTKQEVEERESRNATEMKDMRRKLEFALGELEKHINEEARSLRSDSIDLRKRVENLRDNLAKYEDVIDKKINTDIMARIEHLDSVVSVYEKDMSSFRNDTVSKISRHEESIVQLISSRDEHSSKIESHSSIFSKVETRLVDMDKKTKAVAESLLITSEGQFTEMKKEYDVQIAELVAITSEQGQVLDSHNESLAHVAEHSRKFEKDLLVTNQEVEELKRQTEEDRGLVVLRFKETKDSLESYFKCLETIQSTQNEESSRVEIIEKQTESQERLASQLEEKIKRMERFGEEQNSLIMAVEKTAHEKADEIEQELQEYVNNSQKDLRNIRGSTVIIKSEGSMAANQPDVSGVYRMVDSFDNRPVYKQDGGENYIYYSAASRAWFVGTVVGHRYGWLKNASPEASAARWVPDLRAGWQYRPLVRTTADSIGQNTWLTDDQTIRMEPLRDVDNVGGSITEIQQFGTK